MNSNIAFSNKTKIVLIAVMVLGAILVAVGVIVQKPEASQLWANVLLNGYFFIALAGGGAFFVAAHTLADSGWHTSLQRIPEAMGTFLPYGGILMLLIIPGIHSIYHWSHPEGDAILEAKTAWLNVPFFIVRTTVYVSIWALLFMKVRKISLAMDESSDIGHYKKLKFYSAIFLVAFVFTFYTASWDWLMSLDPHWYSSLYGFYVLAGMLSASFAMIILIVAIMKLTGHFSHVNDEHIHDLGKYLFGFSIFWGYLWGSQFLLIWYSNIPEESVYFVERLGDYGTLFNVSAMMNFVLPTILLMTRNSKRYLLWLVVIAVLVLVGQWINFYLSIMPGAVHHIVEFGFVEIGMVLVYLGLFLYLVIHSISKANQVPTHHPFLKESFEYETYV